jgi:hypothetical protein
VALSHRVFADLRRRHEARRWQRWSEVAPEDDFARRAGILSMIAVVFMLLVFVLIVVGLILALS